MFNHVTCLYVWKIYEFGGSRWLFSWLGQKVNIAVAGLALTGGSAFGSRRFRPNCHGVSFW